MIIYLKHVLPLTQSQSQLNFGDKAPSESRKMVSIPLALDKIKSTG